jgi:hypothetical protein
VPHGQGVSSTLTERYAGQFVNGRRCGKGTIYNLHEGSTLEGVFDEETMQGQVNYQTEYFKYVGDRGPEGQKMHGYGILTYINPEKPLDFGKTYAGDFKEGRFHGYGCLTWPDGKMYKGSWAFGLQDGHGVMYDVNGKPIGGEWREGKRIKWIEGAGKCETANKAEQRVLTYSCITAPVQQQAAS